MSDPFISCNIGIFPIIITSSQIAFNINREQRISNIMLSLLKCSKLLFRGCYIKTPMIYLISRNCRESINIEKEVLLLLEALVNNACFETAVITK